LHYLVEGAGRAVVLIHGNPGSAEDWLKVFPSLVARHTVIAFDRPGHGLSQRPKHGAATLEIQARLIHDALAHLKIERPIIVGHSWAAALALFYAINYPKETAGVVVVAPAVYESQDDESFLAGLPAVPVIGDAANYVLTPLFGSSLVRSQLKKAFSPEPVPKSYEKTAVNDWTKPSRVRAYAVDDSTFNSSLRKFSFRYAEIILPVSILAGDSDLIVSGAENARRLHEALPKSRLVVLLRTGHEIPITKPQSVVHQIERVERLARQKLRS
jgi:pimeloyl-ACP methyl ester carboxylesterase